MSSQTPENGSEKSDEGRGFFARLQFRLLAGCRRHPRWASLIALGVSITTVLAMLSLVFRRALLAWCLEWGGGHFLHIPVNVEVQDLGWNQAVLSLKLPTFDLTLSPVLARWRFEVDAFHLHASYEASSVESSQGKANGVVFDLNAVFPSAGVTQGKLRFDVEKFITPWGTLEKLRAEWVREKSSLMSSVEAQSPAAALRWKAQGESNLLGPVEFHSGDWQITAQLRSEGDEWSLEEGAVRLPKGLKPILGDFLPFTGSWNHRSSEGQWALGPAKHSLWEMAKVTCLWKSSLECSLAEGGWVGLGQWQGTTIQSFVLSADPRKQKGSLTLGGMSYPLGDATLNVASLNLEIQNGEGGWQGALSGMDIAHSRDLWYAQQLRGNLRQQEQEILLEGGLEDMLSTRWFNFKSVLSLETGKWTANVDQSWDFASGADFSNLSDIFSQKWMISGGQIQLVSEVEILPKFKTSAKVRVDGLFGTFDGVPYTGMSGNVELTRFSPLRLRRPAKLTLESIGEKLPFTEIRLDINSHKKGLMVERAETYLGKGKVWALPFVLDSSGEFETDVSLSHIDMGWVLEKAQMETLQGSGKLQGILPVQWKDGYLYIRNGKLKDDGGQGWIQYRDGTLTVDETVDYLDQFQSLLAQGQQALVFKALDNFFFKDFSLVLNRNPQTGLDATLAIEGKNPDLAKGQPFKFNIALTGQVENAVKQSLMRAMMDPEAFTEQFQNGQ